MFARCHIDAAELELADPSVLEGLAELEPLCGPSTIPAPPDFENPGHEVTSHVDHSQL